MEVEWVGLNETKVWEIWDVKTGTYTEIFFGEGGGPDPIKHP